MLVIFDPSPLILTHIDFRMTSSKKNVVNLQFLPSLSIPSKLPTSFMLGFKKSSVFTKLTEILKLGFTNQLFNWKIMVENWNKEKWPNFSAIVYIAVRIHVMFDYMNHNIGFFHGNNPMLCFMFMLNIPNLQRVKLDYFMFHFMLCL